MKKRGLTACLIFFSATLFAGPPFMTARENYLEGLEALERYDDYTASEYFHYAIEKNPYYFEPYFGLARLLFLMGQYEQALGFAETAEKLNTGHIDLLTLKGRILVGLGRFDEARALFEEVLSRQSFNVDARLGLADLAVVAGTYDTALKSYESILKMVPNDKRALLSMIVIYDSLGSENQARNYIDKCLSVFPNDINVRLITARHYHRTGNNATAELHARIALDLKPDFSDAVVFLAELYLDQGRTADAENVLLPFLDYRCDLFPIYYLLGEVNRQKADFRKAADFYRQAQNLRYGDEVVRIAYENLILADESLADLAPEAADWHFSSATEYFRRNYDRQGRTEILRGLRLAPDSPTGLKLLGESYKSDRLYGHYTELLKQLTALFPDDVALKDEAEIYNNLLNGQVAADWKINQFSVVRTRFPLAVYMTKKKGNVFHYGLEQHLLSYYESFLLGDNDFFEIIDTAVVDSFSQAFERAKRSGAASFLLLNPEENDRSIQLDCEIYFAATGLRADTFRITKIGNRRFANSAEALSASLTAAKPVTGAVVRYEFGKILINLGKLDGIKSGDRLNIVRQGYLTPGKKGLELIYRDSSVLGAVVADRVDDCITECKVEKRFFYDFINEQDHVVLIGENTPLPQNNEQIARDIYKEILKFD